MTKAHIEAALLNKLSLSVQLVCSAMPIGLQINSAAALTFSSFMLHVVKVAQLQGSKGSLVHGLLYWRMHLNCWIGRSNTKLSTNRVEEKSQKLPKKKLIIK